MMRKNDTLGIFKELSITLLEVIIGTITSILGVFLIASFLFDTHGVPPESLFVVFIIIWVIVYRRLKSNGKSFNDIGLSKNNRPITNLITGTLVGSMFITLTFLVLLATGKVSYDYNLLASSTLVIILATGVGYTAVQASAEEVLFRGYMLDIFSKRGQTNAIMISSALFSIFHFWHGVNIIGWVNIFLFGVFAAQICYKFNNLWVSIGFHIGWNYFQKYIFAFPIYGSNHSMGIMQIKISGSNAFSGGCFGPEGSLIITVFLAIAISTVYLLRKHSDNKRVINLY